MGERGKAATLPLSAAEGAIHPETLRQKDRSCKELWRAVPPAWRRTHRWGNAAENGNRSACRSGAVISQVSRTEGWTLF